MGLTIEQIRDVLQNPRNKNKIPDAVRHERSLRFHSEIVLQKHESGQAANDHFDRVKSILPKDKFGMYLSVFQYPVDTVDLIDRVFDTNEKIFDGRDAVNRTEFKRENLNHDWDQYRTVKLKEPAFWRKEIFPKMKARFNSLLVVDLPSEQTSDRPEPYLYTLNIDSVLDFDFVPGSMDLKFVFFHQPNDRFAVFDDERFRVFQKSTTGKIHEIGNPIIDNEHSLNYCPAIFLVDDPISTDHKFPKKGMLTKYVGKLDWLLFYSVSKRAADLVSPWTIYFGYDIECDFEDKNTFQRCHRGFLKNRQNQFVMEASGAVRKCPVCSPKRLTGPGSYVGMKTPDKEAGIPDLGAPVGKLDADVPSLEYNVKELERLEMKIFSGLTGKREEIINNQAINEDQVFAFLEGQKQVLRNTKTYIERLQQWTTSTVCRLRYGDDFISNTRNLGSDWYIWTPEFLLKLYELAKKIGFSEMALDRLQDIYHETEFQTDPEQLQRINIMKHLDPFRHLTKEEVGKLYTDNSVSYEDFYFKVNFSSLILRFERENTSIINFGSAVSFDKKIKDIRRIMDIYIKESKPNGKVETDVKSELETIRLQAQIKSEKTGTGNPAPAS